MENLGYVWLVLNKKGGVMGVYSELAVAREAAISEKEGDKWRDIFVQKKVVYG